MPPDQPLVTLQREGARITARTSGPVASRAPDSDPEQERGYGHLTALLRQRGLVCTVEYGLSDYFVHASLPDGSDVIISPPQEPSSEHPPGYPESWLVTRHRSAEPAVYEVIYDSEPDGPHARHGGDVTRLMAAVDSRLDQLGVPPRPGPKRFAHDVAADAVLHRAGFVPAVEFGGGHYHRLPSAMTDPEEQRLVVTRAFDMLQADGFDVSCDPDLLEHDMPPPWIPETSLGDRLGFLAEHIEASTHTRDMVANLSEVTAPGDGVLQRVVEVLDTTAEWWEGFGEPADHRYAQRLRSIAESLDSYAIELRAIRGDLADRHAVHPGKDRVRANRTAASTPVPPRVSAALTPSPTVAQRRTAPAPPDTAAAVRPAAPTRPSSSPGR
ncbi:hypothetical protein [Streptomyces cyaneofuscatus]|uniref:hypothetical protein n=1 Tax=Streptomyces cyaneofuscatus TaxID=66883 RepID=UPI00364BCDEA